MLLQNSANHQLAVALSTVSYLASAEGAMASISTPDEVGGDFKIYLILALTLYPQNMKAVDEPLLD